MDPAAPLVIVGGGPVGLALALMLARRQIASEVLDARTLPAAAADRRLLALSRGSMELLAPLVTLPPTTTAPIRTVVVSSAGEFGRVVIGSDELGPQPLGLTVRYGDLLAALAAACAAHPRIRMTRPCRVAQVQQQPACVVARLDDGTERASTLLVNAEGTAATSAGAAPVGLVADVVMSGIEAGSAFERFTRDGPLALLPAPAAAPGARAAAGRAMTMVWCMPPRQAERRRALDDAAFTHELQQAFGRRNGRILQVGPRSAYPLHQQARSGLREHRVVFVGNAAQTLHPVAGQGLNLGLRDAQQLAEGLAMAQAEQRDFITAVAGYEQQRRADRSAILALTRSAPAVFATDVAPVAFGRSLALAALSAVPGLRRQFARLLMFGVRV